MLPLFSCILLNIVVVLQKNNIKCLLNVKMSEEKPNEVVDEITAEINAEVQAEELNEEVSDVDKNTEDVELTDEEKKEIFISQLKESKIHYRPFNYGTKKTVTESVNELGWKVKKVRREVLTNVMVSKFSEAYKKKRQRKNKAQRVSRKANH